MLYVDRIPAFPSALRSERAFAQRGFIGGQMAGHGILIAHRFEGERWLIAHELVHVAQFERAANKADLVRRYLQEALALPGNLIPLEREAIAESEALLQTGGPKYAY